jgi:hypothetical protein
MFLLPEIIWSPIANFYYELLQQGDVRPFRDNFLMRGDNLLSLKLLTLGQFISLAIATGILLISNINKKIVKIFFFFFFLILLFFVGFAVLFLLNNNPQIG